MYFDAPVVLEGRAAKGDARNRRICVPQRHRDAVKAPSWVWMRVDAGQPFFAYARRSASRASVDITLPSFAVPRLPAGRIVHVVVEPAEIFTPLDALREDWLPHVDREHYHVQSVGADLALWSGHEPPFFLHRAPVSERLHWWLLGFYQAEGSKRGAQDFHVANTNPALLLKMVDALAPWGIERGRLRLGLVHREGTTDAAVRALFEPLGLPIAFVRMTPKNDPCGLLYVNASLPLARMVVSRLARVFERGLPSRAAALAYAIGWLDGDGSISLDRTSGGINLRLAGTEDEHIVLLQALEQAFGWRILPGSFGAVDGFTARALPLDYAAELAIAGAFGESMNRARLIHALGQRLARYTGQGRSLTSPAAAARARKLFDGHLAAEAHTLAAHPLALHDFTTGEKCAPYPLKERPATGLIP